MNIQTDFGYNEITIGRIKVFTGKIRIVGNFVSNNPLIVATCNKGYTTLSFETTSSEINEMCKKRISSFVYTLQKKKLDEKYNWTKL